MSDKKETERETIHDRQKPHYVVIVQSARDGQPEQIVKEMGPHPLWKAEKIDGGANINLNHDAFYTLILTPQALEEWKKGRKK
jgi:hypothetical protein